MTATVSRVARLLFVIGMAIAAYFAVSLLDHAARADEGVLDRPLASVEELVTPQAIPAKAQKAIAAKPKLHKAEPVRKQVTKVTKVAKAAKRAAPAPQAVTKPLKEVTKPLKKATKPLKKVARAADPGTLVRRVLTAAKNPPTTAVPDLPSADTLPSVPATKPGKTTKAQPHKTTKAQPVEKAATQPAAHDPLATARLVTPPEADLHPVSVTTTPPALYGPSTPRAETRQHHPAPTLAPAPGTPWHNPITPSHPGEQSAGAAHLRDAGSTTAAPMGTVPSSWWPDTQAGATPLPENATASGRPVRHSGPPS
ncbi:hypothetical protein FB565_006400 [Actinoplanes lutulentus]|uniref:Uncharacterized protein n=1 Tax=Actinoplanes lutulentus TaxID=1287878 RepID=A0A327YYG7_9ACTN|nr:hypothetical protein [Actinoplanes lutulentus]MBB2946632.1 hypothetical protein [Actinoplanes lutulentus]RAK26550.1 hypothetical protein B0I29_127140 [Actinoplanes lutulentus]